MTLEQIQALTDDDIRVRVAELCGWERQGREWMLRGSDGKLVYTFGVPNYPADLNACHEFEQRWVGDLHKLLTDPRTNWEWHAYKKLLDHNVSAPPRARCEAFLAIMGKKTT